MSVDVDAIVTNAPTDAPADLVQWVQRVATLTQPDEIYWCDGSVEERDRLYAARGAAGTFIALTPEKRPGSYLARPTPSDVARDLSQNMPKNCP